MFIEYDIWWTSKRTSRHHTSQIWHLVDVQQTSSGRLVVAQRTSRYHAWRPLKVWNGRLFQSNLDGRVVCHLVRPLDVHWTSLLDVNGRTGSVIKIKRYFIDFNGQIDFGIKTCRWVGKDFNYKMTLMWLAPYIWSYAYY